MSDSETRKALRQWLGSGEADTILRGVARAVLTEAISRNIRLYGIDPEGRPGKKTDDLISDIHQELACFILEKYIYLEKVLKAGNRAVHFFLKTAFINHLVSQSRRPDADSRRYLYKRALDVLKKSPDFHVSSKGKKSSVFSMKPESTGIPPLTEEDRKRIPFPDKMFENAVYERVRKKKYLLELTAYFWNEVSNLLGNESVRVRMVDFVDWSIRGRC